MASAPKTSAALKSRAVQIVAFALLHYLVLLVISGLIFFSSHVPPKAANLDTAILGLLQVENVLTAPRKFLLWLAPGETTPGLLSLGTSVLNSLMWGVVLATARAFWIRVRG